MKPTLASLSLLATLFLSCRLHPCGAARSPSGANRATLHVEGMTCAACTTAVRVTIERLDGVVEAKVSLPSSQAVVTYDPARVTPERMIEALRTRLHYEARVAGAERTLVATAAETGPKPSEVAPDRVSFYEVNLVCAAAPKLGCGSRAKPLLRSLAADPRVRGAWLNEAGTRVAVAWREGQTPGTPVSLAKDSGVTLPEVTDRAGRESLAASFRSGSGWYDSASVDRLSEREAGLVAARYVRRLAAEVPLDDGQRKALRSALEGVVRDAIARGVKGEVIPELTRAATPLLPRSDLAALKKVLERGWRPLGDEE